MRLNNDELRVLKTFKKIIDFFLIEYPKTKKIKGDKKMEKFLDVEKIKKIMDNFNVDFFEAKILFVLWKMANIGITKNSIARFGRMGKKSLYKALNSLKERDFVYFEEKPLSKIKTGIKVYLYEDVYRKLKRILRD